MFVGKVGSLP